MKDIDWIKVAVIFLLGVTSGVLLAYQFLDSAFLLPTACDLDITTLSRPFHRHWHSNYQPKAGNLSKVRWESEKVLKTLLTQGRMKIARSSNLKVVAYSLYGNNPRYTDGALANAKLIAEYFPGWTMRVYHDKSVPEPVLKHLRDHNAELVDMSEDPLKNQMVWRFLPAGEANVDRFTSRDIDARLSAREAAAVKEWEESDLPFHVMRDHPSHNNFKVSGGMWGSKGGAIKDIQERLLGSHLANDYIVDMDFLNSQIWPLMSERL
jgi:hypothetical protein